MTQQSQHVEVTKAIDMYLRANNEFDDVALTPDRRHYQSWYARFLSTVSLLIAGEEVVYAYSNVAYGATAATFAVFTTNLVIVADIDFDADGTPVARAVGRDALKAMKLSASERIDAREGRSFEWPGTLNLVLTYDSLIEPIEIVISGANPYAVEQASPIVALIESLSADLGSRGA